MNIIIYIYNDLLNEMNPRHQKSLRYSMNNEFISTHHVLQGVDSTCHGGCPVVLGEGPC